jgi:hypothetical protein
MNAWDFQYLADAKVWVLSSGRSPITGDSFAKQYAVRRLSSLVQRSPEF